jgi:hypothetical protein
MLALYLSGEGIDYVGRSLGGVNGPIDSCEEFHAALNAGETIYVITEEPHREPGGLEGRPERDGRKAEPTEAGKGSQKAVKGRNPEEAAGNDSVSAGGHQRQKDSW